MSLQHLVSSSYDARISYPHWLGHVQWLVSGGDHESAMYISDLFALPLVPPRWPVHCSHSCFTGEFPTSLSGKAGQSLEEWWHFGGPCRLWHWGAFGLGFDRFFISQLLLYYLKKGKNEKWMSTFALSKQKQYPNWKLQWRWMKYCISSRLLDAIILSYIQILKIVLTKVNTSEGKISRRIRGPEPHGANCSEDIWRQCCSNLSEGRKRKLLGPIWLEQKPWLKMSGTGNGSCEQICS